MKRPRPVNSCLICRNRRVRCDKVHPSCSRCLNSGITCVYTPSPTRQDSLTHSTSSLDLASSEPRGLQSRARSPSFSNETVESGREKARSPGLHSSPTVCRNCNNRYTIPCLVRLVPPKEVCDVLCDAFFFHVYPYAPILNLKRFSAEYAAFWAEFQISTHCFPTAGPFLQAKPAFLGLLFAILFAGFNTSPNEIAEALEAKEITAEDLCFAARASAALLGFPRQCSTYLLAAYLFVECQLSGPTFPDNPPFINMSVRIALRMRLHKNSSYRADMSHEEIETRRRIWWYLSHLDALTSASSELSSILLDDQVNEVPMMSQHEDTDGSGSGGARKVDMRHLVAICQFNISKELRQILSQQFDDSNQNPQQSERALVRLGKLSDMVRSVCALLSSNQVPRASLQSTRTFDVSWTLDASNDDPRIRAFRASAPVILHLRLHEIYNYFYQPIFKDTEGILSPNHRLNAVNNAQAYIQLFLRISQDPVLKAVATTCFQTSQPLRILAHLISDLLRHPLGEPAELSRRLIDAMIEYAQIEFDDENNPGGSARQSSTTQLAVSSDTQWLVLLEARAKALGLAGFDHRVFLPLRITPSDPCICGETLQSDVSTAGYEESAQTSDPRKAEGVTKLQSIMRMSQRQPWAPAFDWSAWDTLKIVG